MKVAIYVRVSTDKQELLNQQVQLRAYCKQKGYVVFNEYADVMSGTKASRPAYDLMFLHARQRYFDLVLFWDLSRFSRSGTLYTLQKLKELENLGIGWESFQEPYFSTIGDFKDVVVSIMSTLAKIERDKLSDRTKAGLKNAKNVGKRGKDKKPRKARSDRGLKRGVLKKGVPSDLDNLKNLRIKNGRF